MSQPSNEKKVQKRKVALFLAYIGGGYSGMQRNPGCKTIEGDLHTALVKAGGITAENSDDFSKVSWSRAARTDKGVSAVGQVVSLKMCVQPDMEKQLNKELPPAIRLLGYRRVTNGFDARKLCDRRHYEYVLPAFAFDPAACQPRNTTPAGKAPYPAPVKMAASLCQMTSASVKPQKPDAPGTSLEDSPATASRIQSASANRDELAGATAIGGFKFGEACKARLSSILRRFCGTHSFHNFTVKGQQWVRLEVVGQSFMMHQIRKMVGLALAEFRGVAPPASLELSLDPQRTIDVPMAPALGLLLHECCYQSYNDRWASGEDVGRPRLSLTDWESAVEEFKRSRVYPHIASCDAAEAVNASWLWGLTDQAYRFSSWSTAQCVPQKTSRVALSSKRRLALAANGGIQSNGREQAKSARARKVCVMEAEWSD